MSLEDMRGQERAWEPCNVLIVSISCFLGTRSGQLARNGIPATEAATVSPEEGRFLYEKYF